LTVEYRDPCPHDGETYDDVTLDSTCEETGLKDIFCAECDEILEQNVEIAATGHDWNRGRVTLKPTTNVAGEKLFTCKSCGDTYTLVLPKLTVEKVTVSDVYVEKLNGNKNNLTITVTEQAGMDRNGKTIEFSYTATFSINNNAAGTYTVGNYKVYVDTKGNTQIRECYIVK
jgi:hypothetical protein